MGYYNSLEDMFASRSDRFKREGDRHWAMAKNGYGDFHYGKAKKCYAQAEVNKSKAKQIKVH